ncbi:MAG: AAC(3) family N-acetyltransferase [Chloroflexi bacterium]|nr:AAC(3) family N-acetyltransferase [Chloroflexota bacterium]MCC6896072.1 AAC(3) family N-acetyltransferase [Anaerolineae bacterium]
MPEDTTIATTTMPLTVDTLAEQLAACGLQAGQTVLVHSSMSKLGWIVGGQVAVIQALLRVLGESGTLMMPTHTSGNTDPARWQHPPVPESWVPVIREHMPAFDPLISPTREMGVIPELFRTWPGVVRSNHPIGSFAAIGPNAAYLTSHHFLLDMFGDTSPIGKLYELDGYVLLLGVDHENDTSLHLAEHRAMWANKPYIPEGTAMLVNGVREWVSFSMLQLDNDDFNIVGRAYEKRAGIQHGKVGEATVRFFRQRPLIDFAVEWMQNNR